MQFDGVKVFSATKAKERELLGERLTEWLDSNPNLLVVDTVVTQSVGTTNEDVLVENLTVKATATSTDLNLTLETTLVDGTPIAGGGVHNITLADYAIGLGANVDVTGNALDNVITGNSGNNTLDGAGGFDTLKGGAGADQLKGGEIGESYTGATGEGDRAVYDATLDAGGITAAGGGWQVNGGAEGSDTLDGIEIVVDGTGHRFLLVGNGGFNTIAAAYAEAVNGDTIVLAPGNYPESLTIAKAITIVGANAGLAGDDSLRGSESVIQGQLTLAAGVTVDGVEILNTSDNATQFVGIRIQNTAADVTITNSLFYSTGANGASEDRGINMDTTVSGHVTIADNMFTGAQQGAGDLFSTSNWHRGVWSDGTASQLDITGNTFDHVRSAINLDGLDDAHTDVSGNTFQNVGTGVSIGANYDGAPAPLTLTAVHGNTFDNANDDINLQNLTTAVTFDATATNNVATGATPVFLVDGGQGADTLTGTAGTDWLLGHAAAGQAGNDSNSLAGLGGDDLLAGAIGTGIDTAHYTSAITAANISAVSSDTNGFVGGTQPGWQVDATGSGEGTDTLTDIEVVEGASGGRILLVGNGGFGSIQTAVDAAEAMRVGGYTDDITVLVAPGVYAENVTLDVANLTLMGAGPGVEIQGTFKSANGLGDGGSVATFLQTAPSYFTAGGGDTGRGVTIAADDVTIKGIAIDGFNTGIELGDGINGTRIENVDITDTVNGIRKGTEADVNGLEIVGGSITDGYIGIYFNKTTDPLKAGIGVADGITIDGMHFQNLDEKGIYVEALSNALITGVIMTDVGEFGRGPAFGGTGPNTSGFGNGIDINLKNGVYSNITATDFDFTNVGSSDGDGSAHTHGGAIAVKLRDDGSYATTPASWTGGALVISDGTINGTSTGIRLGEPGKTNDGPPVDVTNVGITGAEHSALHGDVDNVSAALMTIALTNGDDVLVTAPTATGSFHISGLDGNDTIHGGRGDDVLIGGDGNDIYYVTAGDTVTEGAGVNSGTDEVRAYESFTLPANVENLTLLESPTKSEDFSSFALGPIADGENGWKHAGSHDQEVVNIPGVHGNVFRMSSDPSSGDFGGPYSAVITDSNGRPITAGEPGTSAEYDGQFIRFAFKPVNDTPDDSRLEVDFGNANGTDRNNFMVIESFSGTGVRIAVSEPDTLGNFSGSATPAPTDYRELATGVDPTQWHEMELQLVYKDGANNDLINVYLDGQYIGQTTTFENYRDALGGLHDDNAEANQTNRIFFRAGANGAPQDGAGVGDNQGFYFDDLNSGLYAANGTGNDLDNTITGNSGDNVLAGMDGHDTLTGGAGADTLTGGSGNDKFHYNGTSEGGDHITDFGNGSDIFELLASGFSQAPNTDATGIFGATASNTFGAGEQFHYNTATGDLNYSSDGGTTLVTLATLDNHAALAANQIQFTS